MPCRAILFVALVRFSVRDDVFPECQRGPPGVPRKQSELCIGGTAAAVYLPGTATAS